jgi:hypothetical protein
MASPTIENYLRALRQELRMPRRMERRILREIRMHLIDASAEVGEARAIEALGPPALVAARFAAEEPGGSSRRVTVLVSVAGAVVVAAIAAIVVWSGGRTEVTPPPYVHYALQREQTGDYSRARHWISLAVVHDSNNARLWLLRARIETEVGDIDAALRSLMHVRRLNPHYAMLAAGVGATRATSQSRHLRRERFGRSCAGSRPGPTACRTCNHVIVPWSGSRRPGCANAEGVGLRAIQHHVRARHRKQAHLHADEG